MPPEVTKSLLAADGEDTERNRILDIARGAPWPDRYPARTLRNEFLDTWRDRGDELRADTAAQRACREAAARHDYGLLPIWAGQAVGQITSLEPADLVAVLAADAELALARAHNCGINERR